MPTARSVRSCSPIRAARLRAAAEMRFPCFGNLPTSTLCEVRRCVPHGSLPPCGGGNVAASLCPSPATHSRAAQRCVHALALSRGRTDRDRVRASSLGECAMNVGWRGAAVKIAGLRKEYVSGQGRVLALDTIDLTIAAGEFLCI